MEVPGRRWRCRHARRLLQAYVDGVVDPVDGVRVAYHLDGCDDCGREVTAWRLLVLALASLRAKPDRDSVRRLQRLVDELPTAGT